MIRRRIEGDGLSAQQYDATARAVGRSDRSAVTSSGLLPVTDSHKSTQAVADKSTGAVRGNEVTLVGDVLHVQGHAPVGIVPSDHRVADDISGNRIDVRR